VTTAEPAIITRARSVVAEVLRDEPALSSHSLRTARKAAELAQRFPRSRLTDVVAAAWLHDIGYAARLRRTGFHPLDGALYLISQDWPERIVRLVAHHSLAAFEAPFHGVGPHLGVIEPVMGVDADILISADLQSGSGEPIPTVAQRLEQMSVADDRLGLIPADIRAARYAGLHAAHERVSAPG
jgi:predicted hydrolase (HD superfamily)